MGKRSEQGPFRCMLARHNRAWHGQHITKQQGSWAGHKLSEA